MSRAAAAAARQVPFEHHPLEHRQIGIIFVSDANGGFRETHDASAFVVNLEQFYNLHVVQHEGSVLSEVRVRLGHEVSQERLRANTFGCLAERRVRRLRVFQV